MNRPDYDPTDTASCARAIVADALRRGVVTVASPASPPLRKSNAGKPAAKAVIDEAKSKGLLRGPGEPVQIDKDGLPATASGNVRSQWMEVTPELARHWLENNFRNRPLVEDVVNAYARDMLKGMWLETHQGAAFNDRDELIDGQHRLHAIIRANVTVRMMVTFGLPSEIDGLSVTTMDCVDRGRTRSVADQLKIQHGIKDGGIIAAMCASLGSICFGERTRRLSVGQTLEIYREFQRNIDWIIANRPKTHGLRATGNLAAFAFAMAAERGSGILPEGVAGVPPASKSTFLADTPAPGLIGKMFLSLVGGHGLRESDPIAHLRAFLVSEDAKLLTRGTDRGLAELVLYAIYLQQLGRQIEQLTPSTTGIEYFRSLQPARVAKIASLFKIETP